MTNKRKNADAAASRKLGNDQAYMGQRRLESEARTKLLEQRLAKERGELLPKKEAFAMIISQITAAKTKFLLVRKKVASRHPDLPAEVLQDIDSLHREALEELSVER